MFQQHSRYAGWGLLVLLLAGCGNRMGTVSGTVTYNDTLVRSGTVTLIGADGIPHASPISAEGTYSIPNIPSGDVKFLVTSPPTGNGTSGIARVARQPSAGASDLPTETPVAALPKDRTWFPIPFDYGDLAKTPLTGKVENDTTINLILK